MLARLASLELAEMGVLKPIRLSGWIRALAEDVETTYRYVPNIKHLALSISTRQPLEDRRAESLNQVAPIELQFRVFFG